MRGRAARGDRGGFASSRRDGRLQRIVDHVAATGYVSIGELVSCFGVTEQTVRRDLSALADAGRLRRIHGGAAVSGTVAPAAAPGAAAGDPRRRLAAAVAFLIPDGASVFLDTGPDCQAVAEALCSHRGLSIVTFNLLTAARLAVRTDFTVGLTGGLLRADGSLFREGAEDFLRHFRFDFAVIGTGAVTADGSLAGEDPSAAALVRAAIPQAASVVLVAPAEAFGRSAFAYRGHLGEVSVLVTDRPPPAALAAVIAQAGTEVHVAAPEPAGN